MMPLFSVIVATLKRPSYAGLVMSLRSQSFEDFELLARHEPQVNEYVSRNRAVTEAKGKYLAFMDDDAVAPPNYLQVAAVFVRKYHPIAVSGPLEGNLWGRGIERVENDGWGVGANMVVLREAFVGVNGFEESWGLDHPVKGWRADTDLWWKLEKKYGDRVMHSEDLVMRHPGPMQAQWVPEVEAVFFQRWRARCLEHFLPVDPRLQQFLLETQTLTTSETDQVRKARAALREKIPNLPVLEAERS